MALDVKADKGAGIVSATSADGGCTVRFKDKLSRDKAVLAMRAYGQLPYVRAAEIKSTLRSRPRIAAIDCISWVSNGKCLWDKTCPFRHPPPVARVPCRHWFRNRGECWYSEHCNFLHPGTAVWVDKSTSDSENGRWGESRNSPDNDSGWDTPDEDSRTTQRSSYDSVAHIKSSSQHQRNGSAGGSSDIDFEYSNQSSTVTSDVGSLNFNGLGIGAASQQHQDHHQRETLGQGWNTLASSAPLTSSSSSQIPVSSPIDIGRGRTPARSVAPIGSPLVSKGAWGSPQVHVQPSSPSLFGGPNMDDPLHHAEIENRHRRMEAAFSSKSDLIIGTPPGRDRVNTMESDSASSNSSDWKKLCMLCDQMERTTAAIPCGHHIYCADCTSPNAPTINFCAFCKSPVSGTLRVYL